MVKIVLKEPFKKPVVKEVEDTLETWQGLVGGYIGVISFKDCLMIINEEGKLQQLPPNFRYGRDVIVGNAVFVNGIGADFGSLSDEQIQELMQTFN